MSLTFHFFGKYTNAEVAIKHQKLGQRPWVKVEYYLGLSHYGSSIGSIMIPSHKLLSAKSIAK